MRAFLGRIRDQSLRVLMLLGLLLVSGAAIGLAVAYPLHFVNFKESTATRIDQATLANTIDVNQALVTLEDLPKGWTPGDPGLGGFGIMSSQFCGETVTPPTALSDAKTSVFSDDSTTDQSLVIAQAIQVDKWQSAKTYINDVQDALDKCHDDTFYRVGPNGRSKVSIKNASGSPLIADDWVSATFVDESGDSVQEWTIFAVGDVVVSVLHSGPTRPEPPFLNGVIQNVLARIDPGDFAKGGVAAPTTVDGSTDQTGPGSTIDSGSADETGETDQGATTTSTP